MKIIEKITNKDASDFYCFPYYHYNGHHVKKETLYRELDLQKTPKTIFGYTGMFRTKKVKRTIDFLKSNLQTTYILLNGFKYSEHTPVNKMQTLMNLTGPKIRPFYILNLFHFELIPIGITCHIFENPPNNLMFKFWVNTDLDFELYFYASIQDNQCLQTELLLDLEPELHFSSLVKEIIHVSNDRSYFLNRFNPWP